jgi:cytochrome c
MNGRNFLIISMLFTMAGLSVHGVRAADDISHGKTVFQEECAVCHSVHPGKNKMGPSLFGVVGRTAGSVEDFDYSPAMKASGIHWTEENIEAFIASPQKFLPGVGMTYGGLSDGRSREDLAAYLNSLH